MTGGIDTSTNTATATRRPSAADPAGGALKPALHQSGKAGAAPAEPPSTAARLAATREASANGGPLTDADRHLTAARAQLGETASLAVRNLTFCTEVSRFGSFHAVQRTEFTAGQKVLLYAEIDNLHIESSARGFRWAVKINGQILDDHGKRMIDYGSTSAEEYFQTPRHDFFVSKLYYLPRLAPGRYTLQLVIEDALGHKEGKASREFTVKR